MLQKLSVCFITYNHANFVRQALDSALMQECSFNWEILVSDDCSTDGTAEIVKEYAARYPERIRLHRIEKNVGMTLNWVQSITACTGEYIALLEGDDFWMDKKKLQKQVDFLDKNPQYSFVAHDVAPIFEEGVPKKDGFLHLPQSAAFTLQQYLRSAGFVQTGSVVFRKNVIQQFPHWADMRVKCIDFLVYLLLISRAPCFYTAEVMSAYRLHTGGISFINWRTKQNAFEFDMIFVLNNFNAFTNGKFKNELADRLETVYLRLLKGNPPESETYKRALRELVFLRPTKHIDLVKGFIINNYLPKAIYTAYQKLFKAKK